MSDIDKYFSAADPLDAAKLFIDLEAIKENYLSLHKLAPAALTAAVVKANAYGLGLEKVASALARSGCTHFFVAQPHEGATLRKSLPQVKIMILNGLSKGGEAFYLEHDLIPVLGTVNEAENWADLARKKGGKLPALLHIDTGMNRLGLPSGEEGRILENDSLTERIDILYLMSHLACADTPDHEKNTQQVESFRNILARYPQYKASLANSAGVLNGPLYHFDMTRPGYALYGGKASTAAHEPMKPVVHLRSGFITIRDIQEGESVGYGATWIAKRPSRIGVLPIGYGDGFARLHGSPTGEMRGHVSISGQRFPIIGRISMDLMAVDITELAQSDNLRNMSVELLGAHITIDDLAGSAQTIGYEVLTNLGKRYGRFYSGAE